MILFTYSSCKITINKIICKLEWMARGTNIIWKSFTLEELGPADGACILRGYNL